MTAAAQLPLDFDPRFQLEEHWNRVLEVARRVADRVGRKDVAWVSDTTGGALDNALNERERHSLRAKTLLAVLILANDEERFDLLGAICRPLKFEPVQRERVTPEEALARYDAELANFLGPESVRQLRERVYRGRR